jgi:Ca2+-binding RTX toxin-like protein
MSSADRSTVTNLVDNAGTLYFVNSGKLWTTDGTLAGTRAVVDLPSPKQGPGTAPELTAAGGKLFFVGSDPQRGATLWAYDPGAAEKLRRLSTSAPPVVLEKGKLTVYGYEWDDRIVVSRKKKTLSVNWNGTRYGYATADIRAVHVYGNAGRDVITANVGVGIAVMLDGGDGDDSLTGGVGNDVLRGSWGADTLAGGAGDDSLDGGVSIDWLYGDGGNDLLRSRDGTADYFWGGSGIDTGQMDEDDTRDGIERLEK